MIRGLLIASVLLVIVTFGLSACEKATPERLAQLRAERPFSSTTVFHDDQRAVTCWMTDRGGMACLPDWMLVRPEKSAEGFQ